MSIAKHSINTGKLACIKSSEASEVVWHNQIIHFNLIVIYWITHCGFIIIRLIPIFVDFIVTREPRIPMSKHYEFSIRIHSDFGKTTKSIIHKNEIFPQSTKNNTHENKWTHSNIL